MSHLIVFCRSLIYNKVFIIFVRDSTPLNMLHDLYESTLTSHFADTASPEHRLQDIILDISSNRLFKAVRISDYTEIKNCPFLKIKIASKGIDAMNISNILNKNPSKVIFLHTFKIRSHHAFPIAILAPLLQKYSVTKEVCSKSTSIVLSRIPFLVPVLAQSFCMLHVAM